MFTAGVGGIGGVWRTRAGKIHVAGAPPGSSKAAQDVVDVLTDKPLHNDASGAPSDTRIAGAPEIVQKALAISPKLRGAKDKISPTARLTSSHLYEFGPITEGNRLGEASSQGVEALNYTDIGKLRKHFVDAQDASMAYYGVGRGPFKPERASRAAVEQGLLSPLEKEATVQAHIFNGTTDANPHIAKEVEAYRAPLNFVKNELINVGLLPKDITLPNALRYFPIVYDTVKINKAGGRNGAFKDSMVKGFTKINEKVKTYRGSPQVKAIEAAILKAKDKLKTLKQTHPDSAVKEKKALTAKIKELKAKINDGADIQLKNTKGEVRKVSTASELEASAQQSVDVILGNGKGSDTPLFLHQTYGKTGALKSRHILIDQADMQEWHLQDNSKSVSSHVNTLVPIISMTRRAKSLGHKSIDKWFDAVEKGIKKDYDAAAEGVADVTSLDNKQKQAKADVKSGFDMVLGVAGGELSPLGKGGAVFLQNVRGWNYVRLLGMMANAAVVDTGMHVFRNGPYAAIHHGLLPALEQLVGGAKELKADRHAISFGLETSMGSRVKSIMGGAAIGDYQGLLTNTTKRITQAFGNLTFMNVLTDAEQTIATSVSINRTLVTIDKIVAGKKVSQADITRLGQLGIEHKHFHIIAEKSKGNTHRGTRYAGWTNWDIDSVDAANALRQFEVATIQDVNATVVVPGIGSVPKWTRTPWGLTITQFKSFPMAANEKILLSGIQRKGDVDMWMGVAAMLGLGAMTYVTSSLIRGEEPDLSFKNLSREAVDRSGIFGIFMEGHNIAHKAGILPWNEVSRYRSRGILGALLGPTAGAVEEVFAILKRMKQAGFDDSPITTKDTEMLLRLMPWQNLGYLYRINRMITEKVSLGLGAEDAGLRRNK